MLFQYRQQVSRLLQDIGVVRYAPADLDIYINQARGQISGLTECVVNFATLAVNDLIQHYPFSEITLSAGTAGVGGILNIRKASWTMAAGDGGYVRMTGREWEYFQNFILTQTPPTPEQPSIWAQLGQGAAGTLWVNALDGPYTLGLDCVCYPTPLVTDADPEALPFLWTDAVAFYGAYLGLIFGQQAEAAAAMYKLFEMYLANARNAATPSVLSHQYRGTPDLMLQNRLGIVPARGDQ